MTSLLMKNLEKLVGYKLVKVKNDNQLFIEFNDRMKISFAAALACLVYYLFSRVFFTKFSNTYR